MPFMSSTGFISGFIENNLPNRKSLNNLYDRYKNELPEKFNYKALGETVFYSSGFGIMIGGFSGALGAGLVSACVPIVNYLAIPIIKAIFPAETSSSADSTTDQGKAKVNTIGQFLRQVIVYTTCIMAVDQVFEAVAGHGIHFKVLSIFITVLLNLHNEPVVDQFETYAILV